MKKKILAFIQTKIVIVYPFKKGEHPVPEYTGNLCDKTAKQIFGDREIVHIYAEPTNDYSEQIKDPENITGILLTGSPKCVINNPEEWFIKLIEFIKISVELGLPIVGICFGLQALTVALGGTVSHGDLKTGVHTYTTPEDKKDPSPKGIEVYSFHSDYVRLLPKEAKVLLQTKDGKPGLVLFKNKSGKTIAIGTQGHPEFTEKLLLKRLPELDREKDLEKDYTTGHHQLIEIIKDTITVIPA